MKIMELSKKEALQCLKTWRVNPAELPSLDKDYEQIRKDLIGLYNCTKSILEKEQKESKYDLDVLFGLSIYQYFNQQKWFSLRTAASDGFWAYLCINVIPDLVAERWGIDNDEHYFLKPRRNWLYSLWWYVHLSWQGDLESTKNILQYSKYSTDTIQQLVERTGRKGTFVEVYRNIVYYYTHISEKEFEKYYDKNNSEQKKRDLFRTIMILNTAKVVLIEPALYIGGEREYARSLFIDAGIKI